MGAICCKAKFTVIILQDLNSSLPRQIEFKTQKYNKSCLGFPSKKPSESKPQYPQDTHDKNERSHNSPANIKTGKHSSFAINTVSTTPKKNKTSKINPSSPIATNRH